MTLVSSISMRAGAALLGGVLALGAFAGCSDDGGGEAEADEPTTSATATETVTDEPTDYLTPPAGVTLTEPGADLGLTESATVAWEPRQGAVVALDLAVERIDQTSFKESFEGWVVTKQMKGQTPYFVHATVTNVGDAAAGRLLVPLYALAGGSSLYEPLDFRDETFEPCPGGELPKRLQPGKKTDLCFVYLLPQAEPFMSAAFDPVGEAAPITWTGEITEIEKPKKDKKKDEKDKRDKPKKDEQGG